MKKFILVMLILVFPLITNASVVERPSNKYEELALQSYGWLHDIKIISANVTVNKTAEKFISAESLKRYLKLKIRNFVKDVQLVENPEGNKHNYLYLKLELFKYNEKAGIYFGLISLKLDSSVSWKGEAERIYELTQSIAGSETQLTNFIKEEIDSMIEVYAEDYYRIEDIKKKKKNTAK